ncbi:MAG TPA: phosphomethylpyrimidine synthase, partial [Pseudothermotoga sp.]|nr:phosphomethylpyrimidine synthase [Pseudothermotoga sp.]
MTQMEIAQKGTSSEEMKRVAEYEDVDVEVIQQRLAYGKAVLPKNKLHKIEKPMIVGEGFTVKVNANIGTSQAFFSLEEEKEKARVAIEYGADSLMVLSTWGDLKEIRKAIVDLSAVP